MMKITKILPTGAAPAAPLLQRALTVELTYVQRQHLPETILINGEAVPVQLKDARALEVNDILIADDGQFCVVAAAKEDLLKISGEADLIGQVVHAMLHRGLAVAQEADSFYVQPEASLVSVLKQLGVAFENVQQAFIPIKPTTHTCSCGHCGGDHESDCGCSCSCHDHHDQHEHHHHEHHHHHHEAGCTCSECTGEGSLHEHYHHAGK